MHHATHEELGHTPDMSQGTMIMRTLKRQGIRQTRQRREILEVFLDMGGHPSSEGLHEEMQRRGYKPGIATIYRTLKLFVEAGVVRKLEFGDGQARYEMRIDNEQHLHLICKRCGRTFEAPASPVNQLFDDLARNHAFTIQGHTTYLYGLCDACSGASARMKNKG